MYGSAKRRLLPIHTQLSSPQIDISLQWSDNFHDGLLHGLARDHQRTPALFELLKPTDWTELQGVLDLDRR